jgi:uncharacterized protein (DUF488 family)
MRIVTAGVYGHTEESYFSAIGAAGIDVFVDTRRRRAVRGETYAFANSARLQARLAEMGIRYEHRLDLAPTMEMVKGQDARDHAEGIRRSDRDHLSPELIDGYTRLVLDGLDSHALVRSLGEPAETVLIFCVERTPDACHRSLLAHKLADDLGARIEHILPRE